MKSEKGNIGRRIKNRVAALVLVAVALFPVTVYATTDALKIKIARGSYSDEMIIRFLPDATTDFDGSYDAWKLFSGNAAVPNMFTRLSNGDELTINSQPSFTASLTMDVFLKIGTAGTYSISAEELGVFTGGVDIVMKDLTTNQIYDLRTTNVYVIALPVISQTASARFQVFFSYPAATSVSNASCDTCNDGVVAVTKAGESSWQYEVKDTAGTSVAAGLASACTHHISGLASGNYTLAITGSFSCTENQEFSVGLTPMLLGATFIEFTAVSGIGSVDLSWSTGMESNTDYFTVERSGDGMDYRSVAHVSAAGNSSILQMYQTSDNDPSLTNSYYRIKLTDLNGDVSYSKIVAVTEIKENLISVFPNPASEILNLVIDGNKCREVMIVVRDLMGKEVMSMKTVPDSNHANIVLDIPSVLARGVYTISAIGAQKTVEQKLVIN